MSTPDLLGQTCLLCGKGRYHDVSPPTGDRLVRCSNYDCTDLRKRFFDGPLYGFAPNGRFYHLLRFKRNVHPHMGSKVRSGWVDCSGWERVPREIPPKHKLPCRRCVPQTANNNPDAEENGGLL